MGLLTRLKRADPQGLESTRLFPGHDSLAIVGESHYQPTLWAICQGTVGDRIRYLVTAVLVPEPQNPYDPNAIAVHIDGKVVGHLDRTTAACYAPGVRALMEQHGKSVALAAVIVGGGHYDNGPGRLGVWLEHNPTDFGVAPARPTEPAVRTVKTTGRMRTGFTDAWLTDLADDSYDLSWRNRLPDADQPAIADLRKLLASDSDPIDRHFQFAELEERLYRCRDSFDTALEEYDATCRQHDAEMDTICQAFRVKWGKIPMLQTYRQMAIRQQKKGDWRASLWWAERGLALYGDAAARHEAVEDLLKRRNRALAKLTGG